MKKMHLYKMVKTTNDSMKKYVGAVGTIRILSVLDERVKFNILNHGDITTSPVVSKFENDGLIVYETMNSSYSFREIGELILT